ncbi:MAG: LEPR-XLL domain-containing protein, partial [Gammaproteobacteria bacterium]|nr:LEPR-XLL domain-containing protein [Gammaproteobacteria bacterium]
MAKIHQRQRFVFENLEQRLLFSTDPLTYTLQEDATDVTLQVTETHIELIDTKAAVDDPKRVLKSVELEKFNGTITIKGTDTEDILRFGSGFANDFEHSLTVTFNGGEGDDKVVIGSTIDLAEDKDFVLTASSIDANKGDNDSDAFMKVELASDVTLTADDVTLNVIADAGISATTVESSAESEAEALLMVNGDIEATGTVTLDAEAKNSVILTGQNTGDFSLEMSQIAKTDVGAGSSIDAESLLIEATLTGDSKITAISSTSVEITAIDDPGKPVANVAEVKVSGSASLNVDNQTDGKDGDVVIVAKDQSTIQVLSSGGIDIDNITASMSFLDLSSDVNLSRTIAATVGDDAGLTAKYLSSAGSQTLAVGDVVKVTDKNAGGVVGAHYRYTGSAGSVALGTVDYAGSTDWQLIGISADGTIKIESSSSGSLHGQVKANVIGSVTHTISENVSATIQNTALVGAGVSLRAGTSSVYKAEAKATKNSLTGDVKAKVSGSFFSVGNGGMSVTAEDASSLLADTSRI